MFRLRRFHQRCRDLGADAGDLIARGGLVVTTPAGRDDHLVAMTVVQLDGDVVMRLHEDIVPDVLAAHLDTVRGRVRAVHNMLRAGVEIVTWLPGALAYLVIVLSGEIEGLLLVNLIAAAVGVALGLALRWLCRRSIRTAGGALFRKFLHERN